jgi:hypothetical protein
MSEKVRAKFKCVSVMHTEYGKETVLTPVMKTDDPEDENSKFWEASPSGELKMFINNLPAAEMFIPGNEYYLDFIPIKKD